MKYLTLSAPAAVLASLLLIPPTPLSAQIDGPPVDRDGDGHSDLWQVFHGIPSANGDEDSDGDGFSDKIEEIAGTNPWSGTSMPRLLNSRLEFNRNREMVFRVEIEAVAGKRYQLQRSAWIPGAPWLDAGDPFTASENGLQTVDIPTIPGAGKEFFRAAISDIDEDGDGLSAFEEALIGTSDSTPNSGGTGGPSDVEVAKKWADANDPGKNLGPPLKNLHEVDVAWIRSGGAAGGPEATLVSAVGTGGWHQLSSWRATAGGSPVHLFTTPPVDGHHPKVRRLGGAPGSDEPMFLTGRIRANGDFWLSSRKLVPGSGEFIHLKSNGYGSNASVKVLDYDVAHRTFATPSGSPTSYLVVTPVIVTPTGGSGRSLRVITWRVNAHTGFVTGLSDSGEIATPSLAVQSRLRISHIGGEQFQLTYTGSNLMMNHHPIWINGAGVVGENGSSALRNIRGGNLSTSIQHANALSGLTSSGYATAIRSLAGDLSLVVWDRRPHRTEPLVYQSHHLTDDSIDPTPNQNGVPLAPPDLRDSFVFESAADDRAGSSIAIGDFNGDGKDDVAVGAPRRSVDGVAGAGAVFILESDGSMVGNREYQQVWSLGSPGIGGFPSVDDHFGAALATGDFNNDGFDDLAIGVPGKSMLGTSKGGWVTVLFGSPMGLSAVGSVIAASESFSQPSSVNGNFGESLASGDFNGDGRDDLAISAPGATVDGVVAAGAVFVMRGSATGLTSTGGHYLHQNRPGWQAVAESNDRFGESLTTGDFNNDGFADLVIGVPFQNVGAILNPGVVHIAYGNAAGFDNIAQVSRNGFLNGSNIHGAPGVNEFFGHSLAAGDFNGDGFDDLAIGIPFDGDLHLQGGSVHVLAGGASGLHAVGNLLIAKDALTPIGGSLPSAGAAFDRFGYSLATADCNGDGFADLIVGTPGEILPPLVVGGVSIDSGAITIIRGGATGLTAAGALLVHQNTDSIPGTAAAGDFFSGALAAGGDFDGDGNEDIVVGVPLKDVGTDVQFWSDRPNCGAVLVLPGSTTAIISAANSREWHVQRREGVRGVLSDLATENYGGKGAGALYVVGQTLPRAHLASSTKMMTLLLAVEAIEDGKAALYDFVEVSNLAGTTGGSKLATYFADGTEDKDEEGNEKPFIQPGDRIPLRLLLAGMMNESCNRCSVAIGEYIAEKVKDDPTKFISMMNKRAVELEMLDSEFGHAGGGWVGHPQDAVTLLREGVKHPLFVEFASLGRYGERPDDSLCGFMINDEVKCTGPFNQFTSLGSYPGRLAWKGGAGLIWARKADVPDVPVAPDVSGCTASRVVAARRMDRTLAVGLMQAGDATEGGQRMMDYGYMKIFTPDARGVLEFPAVGGIVGPEGPIIVKNFASDAWEGGRAVTAIIDDNDELRLNIWALDFDNRTITSAGVATHGYNLVSGVSHEVPTLVDLQEVPGNASIADFFSVNLIGDRLELKIWRIGSGFGPTGGGLSTGP